jgi:exosortase
MPGPAPRTFPDDVSLWAAFRLRAIALRDDLLDPEQRQPLLLIVMLVASLVFSYWPGLLNARAAWSNPQYSHGWLVPLFSVAMLFWWRQPVPPVTISARCAGICLLVGSFALRLFVARYRIITIDMYTLVPAVAGVFLLCGGWSMFRWACLPIAFLIFMYPLPDEATRYLLGPLQTLATAVSTFGIQTLGIDAIREGNQIIVGNNHLGVVDACSGLRMLTIFIALSAAIAMLGRGDWLENAVIVASSVPIALVVNAIRITITGVMYTYSPDVAEKIFHDWAGYFMMPLALGMLYIEQHLLDRLFVPQGASPRLAPALLQARRIPASPGRRKREPVRVTGVFRPQSPLRREGRSRE